MTNILKLIRRSSGNQLLASDRAWSCHLYRKLKTETIYFNDEEEAYNAVNARKEREKQAIN